MTDRPSNRNRSSNKNRSSNQPPEENSEAHAAGTSTLPPSDDLTGSYMIDLQIHTDDPRRRELIERYWRLAQGGGDFAEPLDTLKEEFGLSRGGIVGIVRAESTAESGVHLCTGCGDPKEFDCRKDYRSTPKQRPFVCQDCATKSANAGPEDEQPSRSPQDPSRAQARSEANGRSEAQDSGKGAPADPPEKVAKSRPEETVSKEGLQQSLHQLAQLLDEASQHAKRLSDQIPSQ